MDSKLKYAGVVVVVMCSYVAWVSMSWLGMLLTAVLAVFLPRFLAGMLTDCDLVLFLAEKFGRPIDMLKGQVVWVTGASSGIGESLAACLSSHGVKLVLSARRKAELERVKEQCLALGKCSDSDIMVLPMDVQDVEKHSEYLQSVIERFGQLDILVNNAGRSQRAVWEDIDLEVDQQMFLLNVFSVVSLSRVALKYFLGREGGPKGHIAVTSSVAGKVGAPFSGTYTGSKHALHGYFECLRAEKAGSGIHVTLLCPGPVETNFLGESFTAKPNEKYSQSMSPSPFRLTSDRCGYLCAVSLANHLSEAWMSKRPLLLLVYLYTFFPNLMHYVMRTFGPKLFLRFRDNKSEIAKDTEKKD